MDARSGGIQTTLHGHHPEDDCNRLVARKTNDQQEYTYHTQNKSTGVYLSHTKQINRCILNTRVHKTHTYSSETL